MERFQQVAHSLVGKMVTEMDSVTGIWEVGPSPVTHMNLFWIKDLRLGKCICMSGSWVSLISQTLNEHILLFLMLYVRHTSCPLPLTSSQTPREDSIPAYWENCGIVGNCPQKSNTDPCKE